MAKRVKAHTNETIACRAFESALDPNVITYSVEQGKDYGFDYLLRVYNEEGNCIKTYLAQVKYVDPKDLLPPNKYQLSILDYNTNAFNSSMFNFIVKKNISTEFIREQINSFESKFDMLLVYANYECVFFLWLQDYYNYFLKWIPDIFNAQKTITIYQNCFRSLIRGDRFSYRYPHNRDYYEYEPKLSFHDVCGRGPGWLGNWCGSNSLDSLCNLSISIYLQTADPKNKITQNFKVKDFWEFIVEENKKNPYIFTIFSKFAGLLTPTYNMISWAMKTIDNWEDIYAIPISFQILSNSLDNNINAYILDILEKIEPFGRYWWGFHEIPSYINSNISNRLDVEYFMGINNFLYKTIINHNSLKAQYFIIMAFANWDYSHGFDNQYERSLSDLVKKDLINKNHESYLRLCELCKVNSNESSENLLRAINHASDVWNNEQADK